MTAKTSAPAIRSGDLKMAALLASLAVVGGLTPRPLWAPTCRALARLRFGASPSDVPELRRRLPAAVLRRMGADSAAGLRTHFEAIRYEEYLYVLRHWLPGGWRPAARLVGGQHIEAALAEGRGAILWIGQFGPHHLVAKKALHDAGFPTCHLSEPEHPFSGTRFGMRFLNPIAVRVENRYLAERALLPPEAESPDGLGVGALRVMRRRLAKNGLVSITVAATARRVLRPAFFNGSIALPTAPVNLSLSTGAPLLPVFPIRTARGAYDVHIESSLTAPGATARQTAIGEALAAYASLLESYVAAYPQQWVGPLDLRPAEAEIDG